MANVRIPCLVAKRNQGGVVSWYWQPSKTLAAAGFKPLALGKDEGAAIVAARARNAEVDAWKAGAPVATPALAARIQQGTVAALIARYRRDHLAGTKPNGRALLKPKTRGVYETSLARIEAWAGNQPLAFITPARVRALRDATARPPEQGGLGHSAAFNLLKMLRQLLAFAESIDWLPKGANPATDFGLGAPPPRRTIWTLEHDAAFDAAAYDLGMPGMALARAIGLYSAQREGDLIAFTEPQFAELALFDVTLAARLAGADRKVMGWILAQGKTSTDYVSVELEIPFEPAIAERVAAAIRANRARDRAATPPRLLTHVLIDDATGLPWATTRQFYAAFRKVLEHAAAHTGKAEMLDLWWHDLRRTRVVRLRRRGMPKEMIASITGHSLQAIEEMLKVYGPVDPTVTAAAIVSAMDPEPATAVGQEQSSA